MFFGLGAATLLSGNLRYTTWWGAAAFAPFALIMGLLAFVALSKSRTKEDSE
jgi:hypothetical protein